MQRLLQSLILSRDRHDKISFWYFKLTNNSTKGVLVNRDNKRYPEIDPESLVRPRWFAESVRFFAIAAKLDYRFRPHGVEKDLDWVEIIKLRQCYRQSSNNVGHLPVDVGRTTLPQFVEEEWGSIQPVRLLFHFMFVEDDHSIIHIPHTLLWDDK